MTQSLFDIIRQYPDMFVVTPTNIVLFTLKDEDGRTVMTLELGSIDKDIEKHSDLITERALQDILRKY